MSLHTGSFGYGGVQRSYSFRPGYGVLVGTGSVEQMPDINIEQVYFRANPDNTSNIYIGSDNSVNANNGMILEPGDYSPWHPVKNLSMLWFVADVGDDLRYVVVI